MASRWDTCVLTVGMLTHSLSQISRFVRPMATSRRISRSRPVSPASSPAPPAAPGAGAARTVGSDGAGAPRRTAPSRRRVGPGEMTESPACTVRTASTSCSGAVLLSRNPAAPASMAPST